MWYLIIICVLVLIIAGIYVDARSQGDYEDENEEDNEDDSKLPYRKKYYLFTEAEKKFYDVLKATVKDEYLIFAKVRVSDLLYLSKRERNWRTSMNKIQSKHVDFVLCDKHKVSPLIAIELDDSSHDRDDRRKRDEFIDEAFKVAQFPILHIKYAVQYSQQEILNKIQSQIKNNSSVANHE